jgi:hypothetical protein
MMTTDTARLARECVKRGAMRPFSDRLRDMLDHATRFGMPVLPGCTMPLPEKIRVKRVAKQWPARGSITVERADGRTFRLRLERDLFRVVEV